MTSDRNLDLFEWPDQRRETASDGDAEPLPTLAIPCGFRDRRNMPCGRLGVRPVTIDGERFHHGGYAIVHCDPACFRGEDV